MELKSATILFSVPRQFQWKPLSLLIRFLQYPKTLVPFNFFGLYKASHCAILIDKTVYEAVLYFGVRKIPYWRWIKLNKVVGRKEFQMSEDKYHDGLIFLNASCGISYAFLELFGILLGKVMKTFFNRKLYGNPFTTVKPKYKCSEYCYELLKIGGKSIGLKNANLVEPIDIDRML